MGLVFHHIEYHLYFFVSICYFHTSISLILLQSDTLSIFLLTIDFFHLLFLCNHRIPEFDALRIFLNALENSQSRKIIYNLCKLLEDFYYTLLLSNLGRYMTLPLYKLYLNLISIVNLSFTLILRNYYLLQCPHKGRTIKTKERSASFPLGSHPVHIPKASI